MRFRSALFRILFLLVTAILSLAALPLVLLPRRWLLRMVHFWIRIVHWLLRVVTGITFQVEGAGHVPKTGGFIVAARHESAWETMALLPILGDPAFILKRELCRIPVWGWMIPKMRMIPVDRNGGAPALRAMLAAAKEQVEAGRPVVIFPEGTRSPPGQPASLQPGIFALYRTIDRPLIPLALNSGQCWPRHGPLRPGLITMAWQPPIPPGLERATLLKTLTTALNVRAGSGVRTDLILARTARGSRTH